jgi:GMP synthase (glutamine-hydrolysing)
MKVHIILHESFEAPGAIETWAKNCNHEISYTHLYLGDVLPKNSQNIDFLIVMGGPQSPATTQEESAHFNALQEIAFIKDAIDRDKFVLGVCLGAQLIGEAFGAEFEHSPNKEIGVFDLHITEEGKQDSIFSTFSDTFSVGHWHGDMPGLTKESAVLATSEGCPRQIVRYSPKIYGFQCHFEFTDKSIEGMIKNCAHELDDSFPYIQNAEELRKNNYEPINELLFTFLDKLTTQI